MRQADAADAVRILLNPPADPKAEPMASDEVSSFWLHVHASCGTVVLHLLVQCSSRLLAFARVHSRVHACVHSRGCGCDTLYYLQECDAVCSTRTSYAPEVQEYTLLMPR